MVSLWVIAQPVYPRFAAPLGALLGAPFPRFSHHSAAASGLPGTATSATARFRSGARHTCTQSKIDEQMVLIDEIERNVARLMRRQNLITAREAMRALEWFICLETVGAKSRVLKERLFTIGAIEKYFEKRSELKRKLPTWVTPEVVVELRKSEHDGNDVFHDLTFTRDDVVEAFADADPDSEALKMKMLKMLDAYYTAHSLPFGAPLVTFTEYETIEVAPARHSCWQCD